VIFLADVPDLPQSRASVQAARCSGATKILRGGRAIVDFASFLLCSNWPLQLDSG